jgi:pyruvate kinase
MPGQIAGLPAYGTARNSDSNNTNSPGTASSFATIAGMALAAAALVARGSRVTRRAAETFQQLPFSFPSLYEQIADTNPKQKNTDIICTIGPKSWDPEVLVQLMKAGMNVIRCNMSHGDHEEQSMKLANLEKAYELAPEFKGKIRVLMDTRGPEIRTGTFEVYNSKKELKAGQDFKLMCDDYSKKGDESAVSITYSELPSSVKPGQQILIQDGTVVLETKEAGDGFVMCKVLNDCKLGEKKNVNVPGVKVNIPVVDEREIFDIKDWAVPKSADYIALSFVQSPEDVKACRKACEGSSKPINVISKIENVEGLKNFDAILEESDGIMVARGDLGMEIPMEKIFMAQKMMIKKTKAAGKYVVTATEMLASMEDKPFPTRAEACDVANAVLDGTDAVMLSSESAMGDFVVETVTTMRRICEEAEHALTTGAA